MSKYELILRISKKKSSSGRYSLEIATNLSEHSHAVNLPSTTVPKIGTDEMETVSAQLRATLETVFGAARHILNQKNLVSYKCIFSDKFIAIGCAAAHDERVETYKELSIPMSEEECMFVFEHIPSQCWSS